MTEPSLEDRAVAAYLGLALGDALGATVEFLTPREITHRYACQGGLHREIEGGGWLRLPPGQVTDDTTMALALGEAILAEGGRVAPLAVARAFDAWMRAKPVDIGNTVRRGILHFRRSGEPWVEPSPDAGNGAAMRCLPVALVLTGATPEELAEAALAQAWVTHRNPLSDAATVTLVAMLDLALAGAGQAALLARAEALAAAHRDFAWRERRQDNPSGYIVDSFRAVLQALELDTDFERCVVGVANRGGDADTTAAIVGMLAGALHGPGGLPERWLRRLEASTRRACEAQARRLVRLSPRVASLAGAIAALTLSRSSFTKNNTFE
jgi:ADP-ribosyl-[dinitrogen reductase] hydrolase